mmetsp:Transcript_36741/g.77542  ORF Transcript_36741/g.77542 Transcript_36741/m.77542 type:complete len:104 (+) Transcript_36741:523-834(+)
MDVKSSTMLVIPALSLLGSLMALIESCTTQYLNMGIWGVDVALETTTTSTIAMTTDKPNKPLKKPSNKEPRPSKVTGGKKCHRGTPRKQYRRRYKGDGIINGR